MQLDRTSEYGIWNYKAEFVAHVCYLSGQIIIYRTKDMRKLLKQNEYPHKPTYTNGCITAWGYCVPIEDVPAVRVLPIPQEVISGNNCTDNYSTSSKGNSAVDICLSVWSTTYNDRAYELITAFDEQIAGNDVLVKFNNGMQCNVQVKMDYRGGAGSGCYGNIYVQTHECNPTGAH